MLNSFIQETQKPPKNPFNYTPEISKTNQDSKQKPRQTLYLVQERYQIRRQGKRRLLCMQWKCHIWYRTRLLNNRYDDYSGILSSKTAKTCRSELRRLFIVYWPINSWSWSKIQSSGYFFNFRRSSLKLLLVYFSVRSLILSKSVYHEHALALRFN